MSVSNLQPSRGFGKVKMFYQLPSFFFGVGMFRIPVPIYPHSMEVSDGSQSAEIIEFFFELIQNVFVFH